MKSSLVRRVWGAKWPRLLAGDAVVIGLLAAGVVLASLPRGADGAHACAEVLVAGEKVATLDLAQEGVTEVLGPIGVTRVEVRGGRVRVLSSPCPRQICRHGGWVGAPGELLVCLPNEVVVRVPGTGASGRDAVSR